MIYKIAIENFYSIRERQEIDLSFGPKVKDEDGVLVPIYTGAKERAPRVVGVYGPNASGKTTVLRAIWFASWFFANSWSWTAGQRLPLERFNTRKNWVEPIKLEIHFNSQTEPLNPNNNDTCPYVYRLELIATQTNWQNRVTLGDKVVKESLYYKPQSAKRFVRLFEREPDGEIKFGWLFDGVKKPSHLRDDASVISTLAQYGVEIAQYFHNIGNSVYANLAKVKIEDSEERVISYVTANPSLLDAMNREIQRFDLGIKAVGIVNRGHRPAIEVTHEAMDDPMPYFLESQGTRSFLNLYPLLHGALQTGGIAAVDELDSAIHPAILPELLRWFYDEKTNPYGAQLWFSGHAVALMNDLLREQVVLCQKNREGATEIYALADVEGARRDENIAAKYMSGRYGAVPVIG